MDGKEAVTWLLKAAEHGHAGAQFNLGKVYSFGRGVKQDHKKAAPWFRMAAEQGHPPAQSSLGLMYVRGQGVKKDHVEAHMWFSLAAASSSKSAAKNKASLEKMMSAPAIESARKMAREWVKKR